MRIGIDATPFIGKEFTGVSRSVYEILKVWINDHPEHEFYLMSPCPIHLDLVMPDNWHIVVSSYRVGGVIWFSIVLPHVIKKLKLDAFWGTNFQLPNRVPGTKMYVTIYDLAIFRFHGIGTFSNQIKLKTTAKSSCRNANKIIAISEATKKDVIEIFDIPSNKVIVSYCGGTQSMDDTKYDKTIKNPDLASDVPFLLFISTIEPRKNVITIVKAYELYRKNHPDELLKLILAGKKGWKCEDVFEKIAKSPYRKDIVLPGFISAEEKIWLLQNAKAFLYPSLYEGFGIPILEAMNYDLPVITSRVSSLPEVGGNAVYYIEQPTDAKELEQQISHVLSMDKDEYNALKVRMHAQRQKFSWNKNAEEVLKIIEN